MTKEPPGVIVIIHRQGRFLMQLRDENSPRDPHTWVFPGGKCDENEDFIHAALREAEEETGLKLKSEACKLLMKRLGDNNHVFLCEVDQKQEPTLGEGAALEWMSIEQIRDLSVGYDQDDVVEALSQHFR